MDMGYETAFGELISLARITDGNPHLITPGTTALIRQCLEQIAAGREDPAVLCRIVAEEKRKMVPDCFQCANPCGKTFPFDFRQLPDGECGRLKLRILDALCHNSGVEESLLYQCLTIVGLEGYEEEELTALLHKIA